MSEFEIREEPRRRTAVIRASMPQAQMPGFMDGAFPRLFHAVVGAGLTPAGAPFTRYFAFDPEQVDFEVGVPLVEAPGAPEPAFAGSGDVQPGELPGGQVAVGWHVGPYETIPSTYEKLMGWVADQGREPAGPLWEVYMTDPSAEPDPAKWRTELFIPLA